MTVVHFDLADPAGGPLGGFLSLVPTRRVTVGDEIRLPTALRVRLEAGEASVELMPSTTQWVWRVSELVPGGITRYVAVPDSERTAEYADLESVDPASLDVSSASVPAWEIATRTAQEMLDKVGEIDGKVERAEDAAAGAESSAGAAESHENAARSSADAAASSARDAASSATAAASSAGSAASSASAAASSASGAASSAGEASGSAEAAAGSATAAALSASDAAAHAESAGSSADAAAVSATTAASSATEAAESVSTAASHANAAAQSATEAAKSVAEAAGSVSAAASHANAAAQSASEASASAQAAKASETNAASSASAAKVSETNAADSATAAQEAVDGFGLEVGTTTTGNPGTDAAVSITKQGTKYTANFTIPRGDVGPAGVNENVPLGTASGIVAQATDAYPALPRKVQVHGRTIENLWPEVNVSKNGVTVSVEAGVIHVTGTASARVAIPSVVESLSPGDKITISVNKTDSNVTFDLYAYNSGSYASLIAGISGTASDSGEIPADGFDEIRAYTIVEQGVTVDWSGMVMLVKGDTVPDVFTPSGVHTVEPTKIIVAGKNLIPIGKISSSSSNGINWRANDDKTFTVSGTSTNTVDIPFIPSGSRWSLPKGRYTVKAIGDLQNNIQVFIRQVEALSWFTSLNKGASVRNIDIDEDIVLAECSVRIPSGVTLENSVYGIQIELGDSDTSYETPNIKSLDFTQSISLSDGDTLTIDRDGTTQIVHSEGEPTVLENVTLPELPAPTFNVYTTGGSIQPTVDVDYEQDVNLVLQALEAKIAALQVADKTN